MPSLNKSKKVKQAVTLIEVTIAVIIIAVVAAFAIPRITKAFEVARAKVAVAALQQIRTGQRIYKTGQEFYYPWYDAVPPGGSESGKISDITKINEKLKLFLDTRTNRKWNILIQCTAADQFEVTATRNGGSATYNGKGFKINQAGQITNIDWPLTLPQE